MGHRLSGLALAAFLPLHFLMLGRALGGAEALDASLRIAELPLVKLAEVGLVIALALHLAFGLRVLAIELLARPAVDGLRLRLLYAGLGATALVGLVFAVSVV